MLLLLWQGAGHHEDGRDDHPHWPASEDSWPDLALGPGNLASTLPAESRRTPGLAGPPEHLIGKVDHGDRGLGRRLRISAVTSPCPDPGSRKRDPRIHSSSERSTNFEGDVIAWRDPGKIQPKGGRVAMRIQKTIARRARINHSTSRLAQPGRVIGKPLSVISKIGREAGVRCSVARELSYSVRTTARGATWRRRYPGSPAPSGPRSPP